MAGHNDYPVTYVRKIRFSDTDPQGIVFNGNYLTYFDDTITDFFDVIGIPWSELVERGYETVLARAEIDYRAPARLGDTLVTGARIDQVGRTSVVFAVRSWLEGTGSTVVEGREIHVFLDHSTFAKTEVPDFFIAAVERAQGGPVPRRAGS